MDYEIEPLAPNDKVEALEFFREFYLKQEPICVALGLLEDENSCPEYEKICFKGFNDPINFKAVSKGKIIALKLNYFMHRGDHEPTIEYENAGVAEYMKFSKYLNEGCDIFARYPKADKILSGMVLAVNDAWKGRGIGKEMMRRTLKVAWEQGCDLVRIRASSYFTQGILDKLGVPCVYCSDYKDYGGCDVISNMPHPHTKVKVFALENCTSSSGK